MTSAALASRFRSALAGDNCTDLNQVVARAEQSISEIAGLAVGVQFALSPNATFVAVPLISLEQIVLGLCTAACGLLSPGGRIVVETRGVNDAPVAASSGVMQPAEARARVVVRAEQLGHEPPASPMLAPEWRVNAPSQAELEFSALEQLLEGLGGRLECVPLSENDLAYVAHLPHATGTDSSGPMAVAPQEQSGLILLIEDEPQVQAVTTRILRAFGYAVITAHNERSALSQAAQYGPSIGLVVSDLVLRASRAKIWCVACKSPANMRESYTSRAIHRSTWAR
ncbi:MAG: hypothetical protein WDO74_34360 [Pseudomonadota bacterium]